MKPTEDRIALARRIADTLAPLEREARDARLDVLAYLIDTARIEAEMVAGDRKR